MQATVIQQADTDFIFGADLSLAKRVVDAGGVYRHRGERRELLPLLAESGFRSARLRLFHDPVQRGAQVNDLSYTLDLAERLHRNGFNIYLAPHYSDGWADPGKQVPPRAWERLDFAGLLDAVYAYGRETMRAFKERGLIPSMVQIGNEITPGMLWEHGRITPGHHIGSIHWDPHELARVEKQNWIRFGEILKASIAGILEGLPPHTTQIMLHIDRGGDWDACRWFFDNISELGVPHDVVGLSYYPFWHGMPQQLEETCQQIQKRYGKPIILAEMAFPHKEHESYRAVLADDPGMWKRIIETYPLTPDGQRRFVEDVSRIILNLPGGCGRGVFYWAPEWIPLDGFADEGDAETCWVRALFDERGNALPALDSFRILAEEHQRPNLESIASRTEA